MGGRCDWVEAFSNLMVGGGASVCRPKKIWQNTVSADMYLLVDDPRDIQEYGKWKSIGQFKACLEQHLKIGEEESFPQTA